MCYHVPLLPASAFIALNPQTCLCNACAALLYRPMVLILPNSQLFTILFSLANRQSITIIFFASITTGYNIMQNYIFSLK